MTLTLRTILSIALAASAFLLIAVALFCFARADRMAVSPEALRTIEQREDLDSQYFPPQELLSDGGRHLRRRAKQMFWTGAVLFIIAFVVH